MLTSVRYSLKDLLLWTRFEIIGFVVYASVIAFLYDGLELHFLHVPWTPVALIGTAVAFLIGFQNNAAYGRAWEARKIWGGIVNSSRTWGMKVQDMVRPSDEAPISKEELKEIHRTLVYRHIAWLTALRHSLREPRPWEQVATSHSKSSKEWREKVSVPEHSKTLQEDITSYLPLAELDYVMSKQNKSTAILYLQSRNIRKLKDKGLVWQFSFLELENLLEELFTLQGKSERIKNFPYPRQYATISHWFIWMFLVLLPLGIVPEFEKVSSSFKEMVPFLEECFFWGSVPFCAAVSWVFHTMERIGKVGENPFEGGPNDVPISTIARGIEIDIRQQLNDEPKSIPEKLPEVHNVQM